MRPEWPVEIAGTGSSIPQRVVTNDELAKLVDTSDEWIVTRTGIRERRYAADDETTLTLSLEAARQAMAEAGIAGEDLDMIICGTVTPDVYLPATACQLQHHLGARNIPAFDLHAACSGFVFSFVTAAQFIGSGTAKTVLTIGAETLSRITDMQDRGTCILFGDGAAAAVLRRTESSTRRLISTRWGCDGGGAEQIWVPGGGSRWPASEKSVNDRMHFLKMRGREVYKFAVVRMQELIQETLEDAGASIDDLTLLVPHQSNRRIIESACEKLGIPEEKVLINIDRYGNTSAASVPIALHEARATGRAKPGDLIMLLAFGAGLTWASALLRL